MTHGSRLRDVCASCRHPVSILHINSLFDHCEHCYARLSTQPPLHASQALLESQKALQVDYATLLSGQLVLCGDAPPFRWRRSLVYLREQKGLTREDLAQTLHVSPSTIILLESESEIVSLHVIIRAARYLAGSLVSLSQTYVPPEWLPRSVRKCFPIPQRNGFGSSVHEQQLLKCIMAALRKLERKRCKLTISRLAATASIKQRTVEQLLREQPALRHRFKASKEATMWLTLRHRLRRVLSTERGAARKRLEGATIESVCRAIGTTKDRLREVDEQLYCTLKAHLQETRAAVAARRERLLIRQLKAIMERRAMRGLTCSRRAIASYLNCEFKNYPRVYATWKELRGL